MGSFSDFKAIVILGNPVDGFEFRGTFPSTLEAQGWALGALGQAEWWTALVLPPEGYAPRDMNTDDSAISDLEIHFVREDFEPALRAAGIDPDSVTNYEWRKFEDAFCAGTHWDEVAGHAAEDLKLRRRGN